MLVKSSAPGKLMLFGDHAVVWGKPCIVTAVDERVHVEADFNGKNTLEINAPQLGITNYKKKLKDLCNHEMPKQVSFIEALTKRFSQQFGLKKGLNITTQSDFSHSYGFGSSSAVTAATAMALCKLYKVSLKQKEIFKMCYQAVLDIQKVGSGFDLAAAFWGKTLIYKKGAKLVKPIKVKSLPILVCYSGVKADTPTLVRQVGELKRQHPIKTKKIFNEIEAIVHEAKKALESSNWPVLGKLMNQNEALLNKLGVETQRLENLVEVARRSGAWGAKLSGAGGGDCIIVLAPKQKEAKIKKNLVNAGGEIMPVRINTKGVFNAKT